MIQILIALCFATCTIYGQPNAFCTVSVADLIGAPIKTFFPQKSISKGYASIPITREGTAKSCPRMGQLLFNEQIEIVQETEEEAKIKIPFMTYASDKKSSDLFWIKRSNLMRFSSFEKEDLNYIPTPIFHKTKFSIIALAMPYYDNHTQCNFSAATRFVLAEKPEEHSPFIMVYAFHKPSDSFKTIQLPKSICIEEKQREPNKSVDLFLTILKTWASGAQGIIPYVLGGSSVQKLLKNGSFAIKRIRSDNKKSMRIYRKEFTSSPFTGLDCCRMIMRAAQVSGIPITALNTTQLQQDLKCLQRGEQIENGDIVSFSGHVIVISDVTKGLYIAAHSYKTGHGVVGENKLGKELKDIETVQDLLNDYFNKKQIDRIDKNGNKIDTITNLKILKLSSAFKHKTQ